MCNIRTMFLFGILLFPCFREKPAFPFIYADSMYVLLKDWFLLSGRAVFYCRFKVARKIGSNQPKK